MMPFPADVRETGPESCSSATRAVKTQEICHLEIGTAYKVYINTACAVSTHTQCEPPRVKSEMNPDYPHVDRSLKGAVFSAITQLMTPHNRMSADDCALLRELWENNTAKMFRADVELTNACLILSEKYHLLSQATNLREAMDT